MNTPGRFRWLVELRTSWSGGRGPVSGSQWGTSQVALLVTAWLRRPNTTPLRHAGYETSIKCTCTFNSSPICAAYMRQWTRSALVQVMACRLFGAKPLPKPMLHYCQLDSWERISVKFESKFYHFHLKNALKLSSVCNEHCVCCWLSTDYVLSHPQVQRWPGLGLIHIYTGQALEEFLRWDCRHNDCLIVTKCRGQSMWQPSTPVVLQSSVTMMTSSNETFSALLAFCAGNSPVTGPLH